MDDLIKMLQQKFGLDEGIAKQVIETVLGFVKDKLPEPMQGALDKVAKGESLDSLGGLGDKVKGLFD